MAVEKNDGGQAFPSLEVYESYNQDRERYEVMSEAVAGMSLRDYFAGQALANRALMTAEWGVSNENSAARVAYVIADAMLKEREK